MKKAKNREGITTVGDGSMWKGASGKHLMAYGQISFKKRDFKKSNLNLLYVNITFH